MTTIDPLIFHKDAQKVFHDLVYSKVFYSFNLKGNESILKEKIAIGESIKQDGKKEIQYDSITHQGFEMYSNVEEDKKLYFLKTDDAKDFPIKVKKTRELINYRKVYHLVTESAPALFIESDDLSIRDMIDSWLDIEHTSPDDLMLARFLILTAGVSQTTNRIITKKSFGKDGLVNGMVLLTDCGFKISKATVAKLAQALEKNYTMFNELSGMQKDTQVFEGFFQNTSDGNNIYEHESTGSDKTKTRYDISKYGYNITHNIPEYYMEKGKMMFEQLFGEEVFDRILPVELQGQVCADNKFTKAQKDWYSFVKENADMYKKWAGKFFWLEKNFNKIFLEYDVSKFDFTYKKGEEPLRYITSFNNTCKIIQEYAKGFPNKDEVFWKYATLLYQRHKEYIEKVKNLGLLVV